MLLGKVTGNLWSTRKDEKLSSWKFMVVSVLDEHAEVTGKTLIAADNAGAGFGDLVLVTQGTSARISAENLELPVDAMIVGVVDSLENN